ncbi:MAG: iron chelate uptake ABC transporter family permease subunit [Rhizobiales bacterium]|nr:iron chelate uptake ABC transporter family permease subunit [Hyphomicrobiales bacterium]
MSASSLAGLRAGGHWPAALGRPVAVFGILGTLLIAIAMVAATIGAAGIPFGRLMAALGVTAGDPAFVGRDGLVLWSIRLPRIVLAVVIGGLLAAAGTIMQGLFRNPLADPGLVGVSSGGALAAAATIVLGDRLLAASGVTLPVAVLPFAAFIGSLITTTLLYRFATREGRTSIATFLLGGLAIAALAGAGIGLLVFLADDRQLRDITFWMLGSLGGATWAKVEATAPFLAVIVIALPFVARGLDLLVLGEAEAFYGGISVERLKLIGIVLVAAATGAAVSVSGVIGFVGIIVPHLLRLSIGPGHRLLLPASVLFGGALLLVADTVARVIAAPAELPIGIVTALIGAPFFLGLLLKQRSLLGL